MGGGRDPRPFRPFSVFRIPQAGSPRSLLRSLRASPPRARDDLFPFRKVCRGKGSIGLVLVFEGGSGLRTSGREEGFTASIGLACWGLGGVLLASRRLFAPQPRNCAVPSLQPRRPGGRVFPTRARDPVRCRRVGWARPLTRGSCRLLVLGGVE